MTFRDLGDLVVGLDGCPEFVAMARAVSGCEVWQQDMLAMTLPPASFDGHEDTFTTRKDAERMHALLKRSELVWMAGVGHMPNLESTAEFNAALERLLGAVTMAV